MNHTKRVFACLMIFGLLALLPACGGAEGEVVTIYANSSVSPWLSNAAAQFNQGDFETPDGTSISIRLVTQESGIFVDGLSNGDPAPDVWIPENESWPSLLSDTGITNFGSSCTSLANSPLVIGMWQPVADSLGYPGRELGWLDIGSLAADSTAWAYYSGGQFGNTLRIGHTHPGVSGSGASTLLAIVQAAQSKTEAVDTADIDLPIVQSSVGSFESAVSWFSSSTDELASTMRLRGSSFLGAGIMYESDVIRFQSGDPALVPVYPFEGTFMATHPACVNSATDRNAVTQVINYLVSAEAQQLAVSFGLRPVTSTGVTIQAPLSPEQGVNLNEPQIVFEDGQFDTIYAVQELWQASRKPLNLVMVLDVSGSMEGDKIVSLRTAAAQFVGQMGEKDYLTLMPFADRPVVWLDYQLVSQNVDEAVDLITQLEARGGTALYDAIGLASDQIARTGSPQTANVVIILTDGVDTSSSQFSFNRSLVDSLVANNATVFTVAYGNDADEDVLEDIALSANGKAYLGDEASIEQIYEEMSLAFGGAVGVGR